jgi:hypothetical protein
MFASFNRLDGSTEYGLSYWQLLQSSHKAYGVTGPHRVLPNKKMKYTEL